MTNEEDEDIGLPNQAMRAVAYPRIDPGVDSQGVGFPGHIENAEEGDITPS